MGLVKKYQNGTDKGGIIKAPQDVQELADALNAKISTLGKKWREPAMQSAQKILDDYKKGIVPEFKEIDTHFTSPSALPTSEDQVKRGWLTGSLKLENEGDVNSVLYDELRSHLRNKQKSTTSTPVKSYRKYGALEDYILNEKFGGVESDYTKTWNSLNDEQRKERMKQYSKEFSNKILEDYEKEKANPDVDFSDVKIDKLQKLKGILDSNGDWNSFSAIASELGWSPSGLLKSEVEKKAEADKLKDEEVEAEKKRKLAAGIPETAVGEGWDLATNTPFESYSNYFKQKGYKLASKNGKVFLVNPDFTAVNPFFETTTPIGKGSNLYGYAFENDPTEGLRVYKPGETYTEKLNTILNSYKTQVQPLNEMSEYNPQIHSGFGNRVGFKYQDLTKAFPNSKYNVLGLDTNQTDVFGKKQPYTNLIVQDKVTGEWVQGKRTPMINKDKQYIGEGVKITEGPRKGEIIQIGTFNPSAELTNEAFIRSVDDFNVPGSDQFSYDIAPVLGGRQFNLQIGKGTTDYLTAASNPASYANYSPQEKQQKIAELIAVIRDTKNTVNSLPAQTYRNLQNIINANKNLFVTKQKEGGIIKAQLGLKTKFTKLPQSPKEAVEKTKLLNTQEHYLMSGKGVAKTDDAMEKAQMVANMASLAPGVIGAGAGVVTGVLEGIEDVQDYKAGRKSGWEVIGNIGLNTALVGASLIGAGFLRGAKVAAKGAKTVDRLIDAEKLLVKNEGAIYKGSESAVEALKRLNQTGEKSLAELAKMPEHAKDVKLVSEMLGKAAVANKSIISSVASSAKSGVKNTAKYATYGMVGSNVIANAPKALQASEKLINGDFEDLTVEDANAMTSVLFAGKVLGTAGKIKIGKKYGLENVGEVPETATITYKTKNGTNATINTTSEDVIKSLNAKSSDSKIGQLTNWAKGKAGEIKETNVKEALVAELNKKVPEGGNKITIEDIKKIEKFDIKPASASGVKVREQFDLDKNFYLQKLGQKYANRYNLVPGSTASSETLLGKWKDLGFNKEKRQFDKGVETKSFVETTNTPIETVPPIKKEVKLLHSKSDVTNYEKQLETYKKELASFYKKGTNQPKKNLSKKDKERVVELRKITGFKKGGIIKAQAGTGIQKTNLTPEQIAANAKAKGLPMYSNWADTSKMTKNASGVWEYNPDFKNFITSRDDAWYTANLPSANEFLKANKSNVQLKDAAQLRGFLTDAKPGPVTAWASGEFNKTTINPAQKVRDDYFKNIDFNDNFELPNETTNKIVDANADVSNKKGLFGNVKLPNIDKGAAANVLTNVGKYFLAKNANEKMEQQKNAALNASISPLLTTPRTYLRMTQPLNPYLSDATAMNATAKTMAGSVSDLDKGFATRLAAMGKSTELLNKGEVATQGVLSGLQNKQALLNAQTDAANIGALNKYNSQLGEVRGKIGMNAVATTEPNRLNQENLMTALNAQYQKSGLNKAKVGLFDLKNNPENTKWLTEYYNAIDPTKSQHYQTYLGDVKNKKYVGDWEGSKYQKDFDLYKNSWELQRKQREEEYNAKALPFMKTIQTGMFASGGTLEDKVNLEKVKHKHKKELEEDKQFYKNQLENKKLLIQMLKNNVI